MGMTDWLPLTHAQRAVWLDVRLIGDPAAYQLGTRTDVEGEIDPDLARQAVRLIMGRHDALRLRVDAEEPRQRFEAAGPTPFHFTDLSRATDPIGEADAHVAAIQAAGLPLGDTPLFRVDLLKLGALRWRIVMICHHLLGDGVSIALIQRHWVQAYATLLGEPEDEQDDDEDGYVAPEPAPRSSYLPVIRDDEAYAASPRYAEDLAHWRTRLTPPPPLVFENRPRPEAATEPTAAPTLALDVAQFARLEAGARAAKATTHRALLALLAITVARRYGRHDLCLGMALHRRDLSTRHTIGMLAGMIAVRCRLDPTASLHQAVESLSAEIDADLRRSRTPIDALGRAMGLAAAGRTHLFDVAVTIMPSSREAPPSLPGARAISTSLRDPERTPLMLYVHELDDRGGLHIRFGFDSAVLSLAEVERLKDRLAGTIEQFCADPARPWSSLDRLTPDERRLIESVSYGPKIAIPRATLPDLFEAQASKTPDAIAVESEAGALTYAALDAAANELAARLIAKGVVAGDVVGVALPRSIQSVVALLAILKAQAVYLPLDPAYPPDRLAAMIEDAGARMALSDAENAGVLPADLQTLFIKSELAGDKAAPRPERPNLTPEHLAYIIYTSGSTGLPKGVAMPHRAAVNLAFARLMHDPIGPGDRVLASISIGFDVSVGQLLLPLLHGATIIVAGDVRGVSPAAFWTFVARFGVTHANSGHSFMDAMIDEAHRTAPDGGLPLKRLLLGGEPFTTALLERLRAQLPDTQFVNIYGPTETCIDATAFPVPEQGLGELKALPIGRPLANYSVHVLDDTDQPVGLGAAGELCIGGAGLADGYIGAPELTAERFVEVEGYGRLYRSGDRVAWREDGTLSFLGRGDAQVKIRGVRIEPGEVESVLAAQPGVGRAAVIARPDSRGQMRLLAYYVAELEGEAPSPEALRNHLERQLPPHMVPAAIMQLDALPVTPNAKLDVRRLPEPTATARRPGAAPRTPMEQKLAALFQDLLGAGDLDVEADFFDLGGHSLLATQLAGRLRAQLGIELPIRALFEAPRLGDLAARIEALSQGGADAQPPLLALSPRPQRAPLSFAQERMWFLFRLDPQSPAYNIPTILRLDGPLDIAALRSAMNGLAARHEVLRTQIEEVDGAPVQVVQPTLEIAVEVEDLEGREGEVAVRAIAEARRPFDLTRDPLLRVRLLRLAPQSYVILLTMHHIISDGWSTGVLVSEMGALYHAAQTGAPAALAPLPIQYIDYAVWQRGYLEGAELTRQAAYWRDALAGAPDTLTLPYDRPRPAMQSFRGSSLELTLSTDLSERLTRLARAEQATPFIVLLSAWSALLARWSGQDEVVVGAPIANRTRAETEGLIGFFVNTLAMRADLSTASSFRQLIAQMRAKALDAYAHQDLPFEKLVDALNPPRDLSRHPIFQAMFVLQNVTIGALKLPGLELAPVAIQDTAAKFDLTLTLTETLEGLKGEISYATDLFDSDTVARLADQFQRLLEAVANDPAQELAAIDLLGPDVRREVLVDWNATGAEAVIAPIPTLFEAQAARTPDAEAVVFQGRTLSYGELNRRSNRLAYALIARGIGPEQPVGVALGRSDALVIAALGVLKAGGVYLPLDPAYPRDRLATMLDDCSAALVVTTRALADRLPSGAKTLLLDEDSFPPLRSGGGKETALTRPAITPDATAYIIYTSGSTGRPKGVAMSHGALANLAAARLAHDPIGVGDRVLASMSVSFDVSVGQLITPLLSGATVVVADDLRAMTGKDFWDLLVREHVTHANSGQSFMDAILDQAPAGLALKRLMLGGEPFSLGLMQRLRQALPGVELFNMYGPTETCIDATCYRVVGTETAATLPIGRPLPNYRAYVLDGLRQPVGVGRTGELHIGGQSLARGYLNQPELTAERFLADPFAPDSGRMYRTGDLARWRSDGQLEFVGRIDTQVKLRGFRIELGEIEAALTADGAIASAAVIVRPAAGGQGSGRLTAYLVASPGAPRPPTAEVRRRLSAALPDHMIPQAFVWLDALPVTRNAKLDIRALPEPETADATAYAPPANPQESAMQAVWQEVLGVAQVGMEDNFFEIGGSSLSALRLAAACQSHLGLQLPVTAVFRHQTVRSLTAALACGALDISDPLLPLQTQGQQTPLFCVHPIGGSAHGYAALARALGPNQPVYGIQALGRTPSASLGEMARDYMAAIRRVQSHGPYRLLGHSFGGLVAFEMARQLEAEGERVAILALLDTSIPDPADQTLPNEALVAAIIQAEALAATAPQPDDVDLVQAAVRTNLRLAGGYAPTKLQAPLLYISARRERLDDGRSIFWLGASASPLPHVVLACGHFDMLTAGQAHHLARALAPYLLSAAALAVA
jgi:amino acid adenylation domain-containing protein